MTFRDDTRYITDIILFDLIVRFNVLPTTFTHTKRLLLLEHF